MHIEHIALLTKNLERLKDFYERYFQGKVGSKYHNPATGFESYFLSFSSGTRLELMYHPNIPEAKNAKGEQHTGFVHIAISCGSQENVDMLTELIHSDGYQVVDGPRRTGDGYYESVVLDPDGNRIELTI